MGSLTTNWLLRLAAHPRRRQPLEPARARLALAMAAALLIAGCASKPDDAAVVSDGDTEATASESTEAFYEEVDDNDPLEVPNRLMFAMNQAVDTVALKPAAATYRFLIPEVLRDSVQNATRNLGAPVTLANDLFQGEFERAQTTLVRFLVNSTIGVLGMFDVAADWGYEYHDEDFGQTLGTYGAGEGFYVVLPILGPSSLRDGSGLVVDTLLNPITWIAAEYDLEGEFLVVRAVEGIDERSRNIETIEDLQRDSIDFYARVRSLYRQSRQNAIANGEALEPMPVPGLSGPVSESAERATDPAAAQ